MKKNINLEETIQNTLYNYNKTIIVYKDELNIITNTIKEICSQLLELAAENALIEETYGEKIIRTDNAFYNNYDGIIKINKQSILDTIKQIN